MKTEKEKYVIPRIETMDLQMEECIAASFGKGAADDAATIPGLKGNSFWKSSNPFGKEED